MPGRSSSSSSRSPSRSSFSSKPSSYYYSSPKSPIPTSLYTPPQVQHNVSIQKPGFFSNMWQGFGLGAGQSIAMNIFLSDPTVSHVHENIPKSTSLPNTTSLEANLPKEFVQCVKDNNNDKDLCKQFLE